MALRAPTFTVGIEEEYMLIDPVSRDLAQDRPEGFLEECTKILGERVTPEFKRAQVEVQSHVCEGIAEARANLQELRSTIARVAHAHDLVPIASSTHPFAAWSAAHHTDKERYNKLAREMALAARRLMISGLHVHVGVEEEELRIDLMNQATYFLPHLLALSTSSPFWRGQETGMMSYRLSVFDELPRTGLPEQFDSWGEWRRHVNVLIKAGVIEDATKMWWDLRPAEKFPTLEMRIADVCSRLEDGLTIAALFICLVHMLYRLRSENQRWRKYANMLVNENRWRAQRYGVDGQLIDFGKGELVDYPALLEEIIALVGPDAEELGCTAEVLHARDILERGTSAHRQLAVYRSAKSEGKSEEEALKAVVDMLIEDFVIDLPAECQPANIAAAP